MVVQVTGEQIGKRVKRQFGDESGVQVTDDDVMMWLNDALREAAIQNTGINLKRKFVASVEGINIISVPEHAGIQSVLFQPTEGGEYVPLEYVAANQLNLLYPNWNSGYNYPHHATGTPAVYSSDATGKIIIFPAPQVTNGAGFSVLYNAFFTDVEDLTTQMGISPRYYQYLVEYCLMKAYEMDENWEAADRKASFIQSTLNTLSSDDGNLHQSSYPVISTLPEDM